MTAPSVSQYQTQFNRAVLANRSGIRPECKYNWQCESSISFDRRNFLRNNYGSPDFVTRSEYFVPKVPTGRRSAPGVKTPAINPNTFYKQNFNYIGNDNVNRITSHKTIRNGQNLVAVSVVDRSAVKAVEDVAKNDANNYLQLFHNEADPTSVATTGYEKNNQTALAPKFKTFLVEPRKAEIKNMFSSNSDRTIFPDKYDFTEQVWQSASQASFHERQGSAHVKLDSALDGRKNVVEESYLLYNPPKYGIRDPGYIINSFNKQILPTVKIDGLKAASAAKKTHTKKGYNFFHHFEYK